MRINVFATIIKFRPNNLRPKKIFIQTVSEEMILQQWKNRPKNFLQKKSTKFFLSKLFTRKWFCNNKNFGPKNLRQKFFDKYFTHPNSFRENDFPTIKSLDQKTFATKKIIFLKTFFHRKIPWKWFCNNKKFSKKKFSTKIFFI